MQSSDQPIHEYEQQLEQQLEQRVKVEAEMVEARSLVEQLDQELRQLEQQRATLEQRTNEIHRELERSRLSHQELKVRKENLEEKIRETQFDLPTLLELLAEEGDEQTWQQRVDELAQKIQRLGPINLAAIEEYAEQSERMQYLDAQLEDLNESLRTLENAIVKIDRETRSRFRETFDRVDKGFQSFFPRLFGGGHAYLQLTGNDLLDTGVAVMARPPGKRNSTIHLLSGGEKALTAVALVFSIFQLNPAPFCMLDEVDAPLDEANVGRFCDMVREMSEKVQFIFITHNKSTMELSNQLMGVTMHEPGVSRIVAVDMDAAVEMAAVG